MKMIKYGTLLEPVLRDVTHDGVACCPLVDTVTGHVMHTMRGNNQIYIVCGIFQSNRIFRR